MAENILAAGGIFHQKWTCEKCGERVMMTEPDQLYYEALHEDCGHVTDLRVTGCGLTAIFKSIEDLERATGSRENGSGQLRNT